MSDENIVFCNIYKNALYFDKRSMWDRSYGRPGESIKYDLNKNSRVNISMSLNVAKAKPYLTYIDGKVYYGVDCTEDSIYVKVHVKGWYDTQMWDFLNETTDAGLQNTEDYYSNHLYYMDLDGKNVKRIWEGGW